MSQLAKTCLLTSNFPFIPLGMVTTAVTVLVLVVLLASFTLIALVVVAARNE